VRKFQYDDPVFLEDSPTRWETKIVTEQDIEDNFLPYYKTQMSAAGKEDKATLENAIKDFCTIYYAWEITEPTDDV
jgi:hypothetical protein